MYVHLDRQQDVFITTRSTNDRQRSPAERHVVRTTDESKLDEEGCRLVIVEESSTSPVRVDVNDDDLKRQVVDDKNNSEAEIRQVPEKLVSLFQ